MINLCLGQQLQAGTIDYVHNDDIVSMHRVNVHYLCFGPADIAKISNINICSVDISLQLN